MKKSIIRASRKRLGLSVSDLAARMNVGVSAAWAWDRGTSVPHTKRIGKLASILRIDADELRHALKGDLDGAGVENPDLTVAASAGSSEAAVRFAAWAEPGVDHLDAIRRGLNQAINFAAVLMNSPCPAKCGWHWRIHAQPK